MHCIWCLDSVDIGYRMKDGYIERHQLLLDVKGKTTQLGRTKAKHLAKESLDYQMHYTFLGVSPTDKLFAGETCSL